jgi:hypothetical protein
MGAEEGEHSLALWLMAKISSVDVPVVVVPRHPDVLPRVGWGNGGRDALHLLHAVLLPSVVGPLTALTSTAMAQRHPRRVVGHIR